MKFELSPDNRGATDEALLEDLRGVAQRLGVTSVSRAEYDAKGRFHPKTLAGRFGSWNKSLELAGLKARKPHRLSREECLADIRAVSQALSKTVLTVEDYKSHGRHSTGPITKHFGTWAKALHAAGLNTSDKYYAPLTDEELHQNLELVWRTLGRRPKQTELLKPLSRVGHDAYNRRFGSWRKSLEAFVAYVSDPEQPAANLREARESVSPAIASTAIGSLSPRKTGRNIPWRLRFLVMRKNNFRCHLCGMSPALKHGVVLVVDHIHPWSKGGETVFDNLQTLCVTCNGGKGDMELDSESVA